MRLGWLALALAGCGTAEPEIVRAPGEWSAEELDKLAAMNIAEAVVPPDPSNRVADDPAAARLGQRLFYDAGLSPSGAFACVSCHTPDAAFGDPRPLSQGLGTTARHAPVLVGAQFNRWYFWDGRADSEWSQALGPLENPLEMGADRMAVARYFVSVEPVAYAKLFGPPPDFSDTTRFPDHASPNIPALVPAWDAMDPEDRATVDGVFANVGKSLAAYERLLIPQEAPFDRYITAVIAGDPTGAGELDDAEIRGLSLFLREGQCTSCHHGPLLSDRSFHNLALPEAKAVFDSGRQDGAAQVLTSEFNCRGAYSDTTDCPDLVYLNPEFPDFRSAFKTPTLRNVAISAPYMHNGEMATLDEVIAFYSELPPETTAGNHRELTLKSTHFTPEQSADMLAFLKTLTGEALPSALIGLPPSESDAPH